MHSFGILIATPPTYLLLSWVAINLKASTSLRVPSSSSSSTFTTHVRYVIAYSSVSRGRRIPPSRPNSAIVFSLSSSWAADPQAANS